MTQLVIGQEQPQKASDQQNHKYSGGSHMQSYNRYNYLQVAPPTMPTANHFSQRCVRSISPRVPEEQAIEYLKVQAIIEERKKSCSRILET